MQKGDIISFGSYDWRVIDIKDHTALIITEYMIERRSYHEAYTDITWADCSLRKYLNGDFFESFSANEQERMIPTVNRNQDNQWYGTTGGADTVDRIFLPSIEEAVCCFFGDSSDMLYHPGKNQRYWFERKDRNNSRRTAKFEGEDWYSWWWLRSPGRVGMKAAYVHGNGDIGIQGNNILKGNIGDGYCAGGIRPVMWIAF